MNSEEIVLLDRTMIDYLRHMAIFVRVIDDGSFRAAAKTLNLAPSRISQTVSDLEVRLGVTLLHRSTRKLSLTNEGRIFYARIVDMLHSAEQGLNELNSLSDVPVGAIRVSLPAFLTGSEITRSIAEFIRLYRQVNVSVSYTDHPVGLLEEGFDLNIRMGWLDDSAMMSRKLGEYERVLVAGAEYASTHPVPEHPADLEAWDWIKYEHRGSQVEFTSIDQDRVKIVGKSQLQVDSIEALFQFTQHNVGVTVLPKYRVENGLQSGELIQLLPAWKLRALGCYAVWPDRTRRESLVLLLVRFLADRNHP